MDSALPINDVLTKRLQKRSAEGILRSLKSVGSHNSNLETGEEKPLIDFCSNDYLGFSRSEELRKLIDLELERIPNAQNGSGGSRLLTGNSAYAEALEQFIANYHSAEAGLLFNSGYDANLGLLSCIPQRGDTIISDELIHASLIDGCRLSLAHRFKSKHNDLVDLEKKLSQATGNIFVVVESVYSMDGDMPELVKLITLCEHYQANLIVDEAHATGLFGLSGTGLVNHLHLEEKVFARIITFGKALGTHGAIILGSKTLRKYLINFARPFIYSTAAPMHSLVSIKSAYHLLKSSSAEKLHSNINFFREKAADFKLPILDSLSAIQGVVFSSNEKTKLCAQELQKNGFDVRAILSPTVPIGKERVRICLHNFNTELEIRALIENLNRHIDG